VSLGLDSIQGIQTGSDGRRRTAYVIQTGTNCHHQPR